MSSFKYLRSCFSKDGGPQEDVKMSGIKKKLWCNKFDVLCQECRLGCKEGAETCVMCMEERLKLDVMKMKYLQSMCDVARMDRWRNE